MTDLDQMSGEQAVIILKFASRHGLTVDAAMDAIHAAREIFEGELEAAPSDNEARSNAEAKPEKIFNAGVTGRIANLTMKVRPDTKKIHQDLALRLNLSQVEVYERAILALKEKLDAEAK